MSGLFSWGGRKPEDSSAASAAVATPVTTDTLTTSKVFPRFMAALAHEPAPLLLDLGPVVGTNISFFGERLACKIFVDDLFADIDRSADAIGRLAGATEARGYRDFCARAQRIFESLERLSSPVPA